MKMYYVRDRGTYRVGRNDWSNDTFNVLSYENFLIVQKACKLMSIPLEDATDDVD